MSPVPSADEREEVLLNCRYGELDELAKFVDIYGSSTLPEIRDENGSTILHMACGNGHDDLLEYLLPLIPSSLLSTSNQSGSTPLHWACMNSHLPIVKRLVEFPSGPGIELIEIKNSAGRSPLGEAEMNGWDEGAVWLVGHMILNEGKEEETEEAVDANTTEIEVEIEGVEGDVAKMKLRDSSGIEEKAKDGSKKEDDAVP